MIQLQLNNMTDQEKLEVINLKMHTCCSSSVPRYSPWLSVEQALQLLLGFKYVVHIQPGYSSCYIMDDKSLSAKIMKVDPEPARAIFEAVYEACL